MMAIHLTLHRRHDADLQHDESLLPKMLKVLQSSDVDLVIGSRMVEGGSNESLGDARQYISEVSSTIARRILGIEVRDVMSGFFMLRRKIVEESVRKLSGVGFKILLDILASSPRSLTFVELPYRFRPRHAGHSKLDMNAAVALAMTLIDKKLGWLLPPRLTAFLIVGGFGVIVHFAVLTTALKLAGFPFVHCPVDGHARGHDLQLSLSTTCLPIGMCGCMAGSGCTGWVSFSLSPAASERGQRRCSQHFVLQRFFLGAVCVCQAS